MITHLWLFSSSFVLDLKEIRKQTDKAPTPFQTTAQNNTTQEADFEATHNVGVSKCEQDPMQL